MDNVARFSPAEIAFQKDLNRHTITEQQKEISHRDREIVLLKRELDIVREALAARDAAIEEIEARRLAFLFDNFEVTVDDETGKTLFSLYENGRCSELARSIHRVMRGKDVVHRLCPHCDRESCLGCVSPRATRPDEEAVEEVFCDFQRGIR